ncbi:hypothetical protein [Haloarchaeobius sp. HRN-SO-5]|uniref:hypothetical protein n=1 Tax=Haloarchaeobius sp. HRN-SO-5 TaxID=3446118 RepID=UPI003EB8D91B
MSTDDSGPARDEGDEAPEREEPEEGDGAPSPGAATPTLDVQSPPRLASRVLVTWLELLLVGIVGGLLATTTEGPVGFVVFLATSLASLSVVFYNVNELVKNWLRATSA